MCSLKTSTVEFTFPVKEHVEIGEQLGILDFR